MAGPRNTGPQPMTVLADPGPGGTITATAPHSILPITSAGVEGRTLDPPAQEGQRLVIYDQSHGGQVDITYTPILDASLNDTIQLTAARAITELIAIFHSGATKWQAAWKSPEVTLASS